MTGDILTPIRITRCAEIVRHWPFFAAGFAFISDYLHYPYTLDVYRRIILKLAVTPSAYVGVILLDGETPVCFGAAYDATPVFATQKEYDIPFFYHDPKHPIGAQVFRAAFLKFCRAERIKRYYMTTSSFSRNTQNYYGRLGLSRSHMIYKKEL